MTIGTVPRLRRLTKAIALRACLAGRFDETRVFILTSSLRSGSTLLAQVLGAIPYSCTLFEPLHLRYVPAARRAGFSWSTFVPPDEQWSSGERFLKRVFEGRVLNSWTAREMSYREACKSKMMIVKFVRANSMLPWICQTFNVPAPVLLLRHPCAVVASQLNAHWMKASRPDLPSYLDSYPAFRSALAATEGDEEHLAALWALDQLPPLLAQAPHPWMIVTYEELILRPEDTLRRIAASWGVEIDICDALSRIKRPSSVVSPSGIRGINGWKKQLGREQIEKVLRTVNAFGLGFYSMDDEPDYCSLHDHRLARRISEMGVG